MVNLVVKKKNEAINLMKRRWTSTLKVYCFKRKNLKKESYEMIFNGEDVLVSYSSKS